MNQYFFPFVVLDVRKCFTEFFRLTQMKISSFKLFCDNLRNLREMKVKFLIPNYFYQIETFL